jgi:ketosteroid isomerase-like protein
MRKLLLFICLVTLLAACNRGEKTASSSSEDSTAATKGPSDLAYTATYTSNWTNNVSDDDLRTVIMSYKDWSTGNFKGLSAAMGDSVEYDMNSGKHIKLTNADLMKMWKGSRDSLKSVAIEMETWNKMYAPDKKDAYIVTWYKETDTYKDGRVDSASYHDINQLKNGKIIWYSQYKRPLRPR